MITPRRGAAILLALLVSMGWFALFRPTALGGPATFVMVSGNSMEPTYRHGDLVVLRKAAGYEVGDIVAYPMKTYLDTGRLVIHRVVGSDAGGAITQGDNRTTADPWKAAQSDIRGKAWVHIPKAGIYVAWLRQPNVLGAFAAGILLIGSIGGAESRRRRRYGMKTRLSRSTGRAGGGPPSSRYQRLLTGLIAASTVLAIVFLALGIVAFRSAPRSVTSVSDPTYTETGSFDYAIRMEPSTLYPDGMLRSPARPTGAAPTVGSEAVAPRPAFSSLAREAQLTFQYRLEAVDRVEFGGTVAADLVVRPRGGEWTRTISLSAPEPFTGSTVERLWTIDLADLQALIARIEKETGLRANPYEIVVAAKVAGAGMLAGTPLDSSFEALFTLTYDMALITPPAELTTRVQATSTETIEHPRTLSVGVWSPRVSLARSVAVAGFSSALGVAVVLGGYLALLLRNDEQARIRTRYGSRMVEVEAAESSRLDNSIKVASIGDISRLAERFGSVILHQPLPAGHRYFVRDGDDTYEYVIANSSVGRPVGAGRRVDTPTP